MKISSAMKTESESGFNDNENVIEKSAERKKSSISWRRK
jgi:hypothetical protein